MSDPILSPIHDNVVRVRRSSPLSTLATGYPPGAPVSAVVLLVLAGWLFASPMLLGYAGHALATSDWLCAAAIILLSLAALASRRPWISWIAGGIGLWVIMAPVILWSPTLGGYVSGTLAGMLITAEGVLHPIGRLMPGPDVPEGWSYNPSAWSQRAPVIVLTAASLLIAGYLSVFQLGYINTIWDPIFGDGTSRVLTSSVSQAFPVSDAALGASTYAIDLLMTCAGDRRRWRTMPWLVITFGFLIVPVGVVSVILVMLQPIVVDAWCMWCLFTAAAALVMIPLAIDEVAATLQLLRQVRRRGESWWRALWRGVDDVGSREPVAPRRTDAHPPWTLAVIVAAGLWVMLQPALLGTSDLAADSAHLSGALVIVVAVVAMSEVTRSLRLLAVPLALWISVAPWLLAGSSTAARISGVLVGVIVMLASTRRGEIGEHRGAVDRMALWPS